MSEIPKNAEGTSGLSKWELALYVGIPVAVLCAAGLAYCHFRGKSEDQSEENEEEEGAEDSDKLAPKIEEIESGPIKEKSPEELAQASKLKGNKYFKGGKFDLAVQCYTEAIRLCPDNKIEDVATYYQNRAAAQEKLENLDEVINDSTKAIELQPKYTKALSRRARALEKAGNKIACLEDVTAVCLIEGFQNQEFMVMADRILKEVGKELAADYIKTRKKVLPSEFFVKSYLDSFSTDVFSINLEDESEEREKSSYFSAITHLKENEHDSIIDLCTDEINQDGSFKIQAHLLRGTMNTLLSCVDEAIEDFDHVLDAGDDRKFIKLQSNALIKRASLKLQLGKDTEAMNDFNKAVNIDNDNADVYHHRGQIFFLTEKLEEAKKDFEKAILCNENFVAPRLQLGYCLCKLAMKTFSTSMIQDANNLLDDTTKKFPESGDAWSLFGQLLQDQQRFPEAEEKLEKAIELQPKNPTTYVYKALLHLQWKRDFESGVALIRKGIEIDPKCDFAYETLATLEVQRGNSEEAIKLFEKAIDLVRTEAEMAQTFSLLEAAKAQGKITKRLGITLPVVPGTF